MPSQNNHPIIMTNRPVDQPNNQIVNKPANHSFKSLSRPGILNKFILHKKPRYFQCPSHCNSSLSVHHKELITVDVCSNPVCLIGGGYAEYVAVEESHIMTIPHPLQLSTAAAVPETWLTAYQLLHFLGKVQKDETVLIHAGGSGVGTSLVQLCQLAGAHALVTAGSKEKIAAARGLGADAGFNYKTGNFSDWVAQQTKGARHMYE